MSEYLDLHALADGQLEGDAKRAAEERLRTCERSRAEYETVCRLKETLSDKCQSITCEETWQKCQGRIHEVRNARGVERFVGKYAWGLCGAFLLAIVVGGSLNRGTSNAVRTGDVARVSASLSPLALPSFQAPEERKRWFQDVMSGPMADAPEAVKVLGAATGLMNGHKVVRINLGDTIGPMALFALQNIGGIEDAQKGEGGFFACQFNGTNGVSWTEGPHSYLLIGDRPIDDLETVARAIRGK